MRAPSTRALASEWGLAHVNETVDVDQLSGTTVSNHVTLLDTMLRLALTFKVPWLTVVPRFKKPKVARRRSHAVHGDAFRPR